MADKLSESLWTGFTKKQKLELDDGALTKALAKFDKVDEARHEARIDALKEVIEQVRKQIVALAKRKKELGDKPFGLAKAQLDELLDLAEALEKKTRDAAAQAAEQEAEEADSPALLTTKMVPLLRELRKGEVQMHALIGTAGKASAVLIMRRAISTPRRKLLDQAMDTKGGAKYIPAECLYEEGVLTFVVKAPAGGLAKRLRQALLEQTQLRLKVKVRGEDGEENDGEDGGEDQAGAQVHRPAPPLPGEQRVEAPPPSPEQLRYQALLDKIKEPLAQALSRQHPEATKLNALMGFASEKADGHQDFAAALQALERLEKLLAPVGEQPQAEPEPKAKPPAGPLAAGPYSKMKARLSPQLDNAAKRNPMLGEKIRRGVLDADTLSIGNDDNAAIAALRALAQEIEEFLALEREETLARMDALYDRATRIRLDLKPAEDTVRFTVRGFVKAWDLGAAKVAMDNFEKAIEKAKPLDFANLDEVQDQRAQQFRKENAKFARNTEQALLAANRIVDDQGNLVLDGGALKGLPFVRSNDLASIAEEIADTDEAGMPHSVHALQMLQRLQTDTATQEALKQVKAPPDPGTASTEEGRQSLRMAQSLIRNSLGLADDVEITDAHAKRAAVAALLAQLRQVDIGSCFATATAVRVQRNKPEQFLADMAEMMSTGKLKREIEHPPGTKLTIEMPISREMVGRKVDVTREKTNLHKKPNMVAGLDALGIADGEQEKAIQEAAARLRAERAIDKALAKIASFLPSPHTVDSVKKDALGLLDGSPGMKIEAALRNPLSKIVLSTLPTDPEQRKESNTRKKLALDCCKEFDDPKGNDDFTPHELIEQIAKTRPDGALKPEQVAQAKAAYDTSHDNTLGRAWEYTIASMMDKHPSWTGKAKLLAKGMGDAAESVFKKFASDAIAKGLTGSNASNQNVVAEKVAKDLSARLTKELEARYDPGVGGRSESLAADGNSSSGGYSLFFRGKKIDGQQEFEAMLHTLLDECKNEFDLNTAGWPAKYVQTGKDWADKMKEHAETGDFRNSVIDKLSGGDKDKKDGFAQPWTKKGGGDDIPIMQLYENRPRPLVKQTSKAFKYKVNGTDTSVTDAEGLTHFLFDSLNKAGVAGRLPEGEQAERATVPVFTSSHAFTLKPGSPSLATALKQGKKPEEFIKEFKEVEGAKNRNRMSVGLPIGDPTQGLVAEMIQNASRMFPEKDRGALIVTLQSRVTSLGGETATAPQLQALIKTVAREKFTADYPTANPGAINQVAGKIADSSMAGVVLLNVIPTEEYGPLVDAAMRKLGVGEESQEKVRKDVLEQLRDKQGVLRDDLAKEVRKAMRKLGLGGTDRDTANARKAYDALTDGPQRIAALKAAGKDVGSPAASFDALTEEERLALAEHGVAAALDAKLAPALVEPRGLVFADPNWGDGDHMSQFSMVVNPMSDPPGMEVWQMNEDGSSPKALNQDSWVKNTEWGVFTDPSEYGGSLSDHDVVTTSGTKPWEVFRSELRAKLDDCVAANKGDLGQLQAILDIADARFADSDFAAADKAINKLAERLAPVERLSGAIAKGVRSLDGVIGLLDKEVAARRAKAKEQKLKLPTPEMKEAFAAAEMVGALVEGLRKSVNTPEELAKFVSDRKTLLDYVDAQSPLGSLNLVSSLTLA